MKRSTQRILTTHAGSLARPAGLRELILAKDSGQPFDSQRFDQLAREAINDVVQRQADAGIDVINDGEQSRPSFIWYIGERLTGFERVKVPGTEASIRSRSKEWQAFPDFYKWFTAQVGTGTGSQPDPDGLTLACTGPIKYTGQALIQAEIDRLKSAVDGVPHEEVFMPAIGATFLATFRPNVYYGSYEDYEQALADAMHEENKAIVDAGFILQVDDPRLVSYYTMMPEITIEEHRKWAKRRVEAINYSIRDIPPEKVRFHTCFSINIGPRIYELEMKHIVDLMLRINAGAYSFEAANPRHEHEYHVWEEVKLPEGKVLVPGVITHTTNLVEHPELIAERVVRYAKLVGRENVIAGADCGFSTGARGELEIHPSVAWLKFEAMAEGARLASQQLWR